MGNKIETVEEYLARGGKITQCEPGEYQEDSYKYDLRDPEFDPYSLKIGRGCYWSQPKPSAE